MMRWLLLASVIVVAVMLGSNVNIGIESDAGPGIFRPDAPSSVENDTASTTVNQTSGAINPAFIDIRDGMLSVSINGMSMQRLAQEISDRTGIEILFIGDHPEIVVHIAFSDIPLEKGLHLLLSEAGTIFIYSDTNKNGPGGRILTRIFLLPEGESGHLNSDITEAVNTGAEASAHQAYNMTENLSEQILHSVPQSHIEDSPDIFVNDNTAQEALEELSEMIGEQLLGSEQATGLEE